jgi:hypothetical protein
MAKNTNRAEYWLSANERETIDCPYQPGNLKISKNACLKRYQASEKAKPEMINHADLFTYTVGQGLLRCKICPIVKALPPLQPEKGRESWHQVVASASIKAGKRVRGNIDLEQLAGESPGGGLYDR